MVFPFRTVPPRRIVRGRFSVADYTAAWQETNRSLQGNIKEGSMSERENDILNRMEAFLDSHSDEGSFEAPRRSVSYKDYEDPSPIGRPSSRYSDEDDAYFESLLSKDL